MTASRVREITKGRRFALLAAVFGLGAAMVVPGANSGIARAADATAPVSQPSTAELLKQIQTLQGQVQQMQAQQQHDETVNAKEVDATVRQVLQDADKRSQLLAMEGFTAGWDKGRFVLKSSDGAYSFSPIVQMDFRYSTAYDTGGSGNTQSGFEFRRSIIV